MKVIHQYRNESLYGTYSSTTYATEWAGKQAQLMVSTTYGGKIKTLCTASNGDYTVTISGDTDMQLTLVGVTHFGRTQVKTRMYRFPKEVRHLAMPFAEQFLA